MLLLLVYRCLAEPLLVSRYHHFPSKCTACPRLPPPGGLARTPPVGVPPLTCGRVPPPGGCAHREGCQSAVRTPAHETVWGQWLKLGSQSPSPGG